MWLDSDGCIEPEQKVDSHVCRTDESEGGWGRVVVRLIQEGLSEEKKSDVGHGGDLFDRQTNWERNTSHGVL